MANLPVLLSSLLCLLVGIFLFPYSTHISPYLFPATRLNTAGAVSASASPFSPSWASWWQPGLQINQNTRGANTWNLFYHLGGYSPWIEKLDGEEQPIGPPEGCVVDGVHMFPGDYLVFEPVFPIYLGCLDIRRDILRSRLEDVGQLALIDKIKLSGLKFNGSLDFLNDWKYFTDNPTEDFEQLTSVGPYAGTLEAFTTGVRLRTRYSGLIPQNGSVRLWASDSKRVIDTARHFAAGFFGLEWKDSSKAELEVIPETFDRGADTLTPGDTCLDYVEDPLEGHDKGMNVLLEFQEAYMPGISDLLATDNPNMRFNKTEIWGMQEMCGFETLTRGSSPWCNLFSKDDWEHFAYARDLVHYYRGGPGNKYAHAMGWLWLNATTNLLLHPIGGSNLFFSFVHDGDIAPMLAALGVFDDPKYDPELPTTHIASDRVWRTSQVMPMGGRVVLERLSCPTTLMANDSSPSTDKAYVRINVNDGIVALPDCKKGPGLSCPLSEFAERTRRRGASFGDFGQVCGLNGLTSERITFLRQ